MLEAGPSLRFGMTLVFCSRLRAVEADPRGRRDDTCTFMSRLKPRGTNDLIAGGAVLLRERADCKSAPPKRAEGVRFLCRLDMYVFFCFHRVRVASNVHLSRLDLRRWTLFRGAVGGESGVRDAEAGVGGISSGLALSN